MMIRNRAFVVKSPDFSGIVVLRLFDNEDNLKSKIYNASLNKYGYEPTEYFETDLDNVPINKLTVAELGLILKYTY